MRIFSSFALLLALVLPSAEGQSSGAKTAPPKQGAPIIQRHDPVVKCTDQETLKSCNSLKELIKAHDERLLDEILGRHDPDSQHVSYVCMRPRADAFSVVSFDIPSSKHFSKPLSEQIAAFSDDSVLGNSDVRATLESEKSLFEETIFTDFSDRPPVSQSTKEQWFQDHDKLFHYAYGFVFDFLYQDGLDVGSVSDQGEWIKPASKSNGNEKSSEAWFTGAFAWLERYDLRRSDGKTGDDDPQHGHISIDATTVHIHYEYKSQADSVVDYNLAINRLTGRFVESFETAGANDHLSGTCMIFK